MSTGMALPQKLPRLPFGRHNLLEPPARYRELQNSGTIIQVQTPAGDPAWLATGYEHVRLLLSDNRLGRAHPDPDHAPRYSASVFAGGPTGNFATEPADHVRMRRMLSGSLSEPRLRALRPRIQAITDELLDQLAAARPPADLRTLFSEPLPALVICELLGVPEQDRPDICRWTVEASNLFDGTRVGDAFTNLGLRLHQLMRDKRDTPTEDGLTDLVQAWDQHQLFSDVEAITLAAGLIFAGHATTAARIDFGTLLLCIHPDQHTAIGHDPGLIPAAVEEILRFASPSPIGVLRRWARSDIEIAGVTIRAGELVLLANDAASHDPDVFPAPDQFDISRQGADHCAFGRGGYACAGAGLARMELRIAFTSLLRRFPDLRLATPVDQLRIRVDSMVGGLQELPVHW